MHKLKPFYTHLEGRSWSVRPHILIILIRPNRCFLEKTMGVSRKKKLEKLSQKSILFKANTSFFWFLGYTPHNILTINNIAHLTCLFLDCCLHNDALFSRKMPEFYSKTARVFGKNRQDFSLAGAVCFLVKLEDACVFYFLKSTRGTARRILRDKTDVSHFRTSLWNSGDAAYNFRLYYSTIIR